VRNPVAHAGSLYHQEVRHRGLTASPDAYFAQYQRPVTVWHVLSRLRTCPDVALRVENYSHVKHRLAQVLSHWLELDDCLVTPGTRAPINRGCTRGELRALRRLNSHAPAVTPWVARALRLARPKAHSHRVVAGYKAQAQVWARNADAMALLNRHYLPSEAAFAMQYATPSCDAGPTLPKAYIT